MIRIYRLVTTSTLPSLHKCHEACSFMIRRSTRIRTATKGAASVDESVSENDNEEIEKPTKRQKPRKKRSKPMWSRTSGPKKYVKGRRGALKELVEMPLDVLFEIFGHLDTPDILHLSRTNKPLRNILMQKSVSFVWKRARDNINLPDCLPDLNEPQYAKLVFDTLCDYCLKSNTHIIIWENHCRICKRCLVEDATYYKNVYVPREVEPLIPIKNISATGAYTCKTCCRIKYELVEEFTALDSASRSEWVRSKEKQQCLRREHGRLCDEWIQERAKHRASEQDTIYQRRYMAIKAKLVEIGWSDEIEKMTGDELRSHRCVKQAKDLTDRIWVNIRSPLVAMLEGIKAERIDKHRRLVLKEVYNDFVASQPLHAIVPGLVDVGLIPQFAAVINSPLEEDITANHFNSALEKLPTFTADWRASKDAMLVDLMKIHIPGFQIGDLSLPTTIFKCTNCRTPTPIQYPRVLSHLHLMCDRRLEGGKIFEDPRRGWSPQLLRFDSSLYESARTIIQTCRLDAATITATQGLPAPAAFFNCTSPDCAGYFMTWSGAVKHHVSVVLDPTRYGHRHGIRLASNTAQMNTATRLLTRENVVLWKAISSVCWKCVRCRHMFSWEMFVEHLRLSHQKLEPFVVDEDYVIHPDTYSIDEVYVSSNEA